jgi:ribosomal protein S18 acetylase RimI-like enzyme
MTALDDAAFTIAPLSAHPRDAHMEIVEAAWRHNYRHLYTPHEVDQVFGGVLLTYGDWVERRAATFGHFVARDRLGQAVGVAGVGACWPLLDARHLTEGEITSLYVLPAWQGSGVGSALWHAALALLHARGYAAAWVWTLRRTEAAAWYAHRGCEARGSGWFHVGGRREPAVGFWLPLHASPAERAP